VIAPNWNIFLWILILQWILESISRIILGAVGEEKSQKYDFGDVLVGIIQLILVLLIFIF
jgi:hypothetical protein